SIDGAVSLSCSDDQLARFQASGWATARVDGHDPEAVSAAIDAAKSSDRPSLIACKTVIGYGAPKKGGTAATHGPPLGAEEIAGAREKLGWAYAPFEIPAAIKSAWEAIGQRGAAGVQAWSKRLDGSPLKAEFERVMAGELPANFAQAMGD